MLQVNKLSLRTLVSPAVLLIFSVMFLSTLADQYISKKIELLVSSRDGLSNMIWFWGLLSLTTAILFPLLISLLCAYALVSAARKEKLGNFISENLEHGLIETLRAWGKTFLWTFVFIIPGIIKYINYILTPFVVAFSERYKRGEVDALEYSTLIAKKFYWSIKGWMGVFYVLVPAVMYFLFDEQRMFALHPVSATLLVGVETAAELLFHFVILKLFIKFLNESEENYVPHV